MPVKTDSNGVGTETWEEHFIGDGVDNNANNPRFSKIQDLIDDNFDNYLEPAPSLEMEYSQSGNTITFESDQKDHNLAVGQPLFVQFGEQTGAKGIDGDYVVASVIDAREFTATAAKSLTASGTCKISFSSFREVFDYGANLSGSKVSTLATFEKIGDGVAGLTSKIDLAEGETGAFSEGTESNQNAAQRFGTNFRRVRYKIQ